MTLLLPLYIKTYFSALEYIRIGLYFVSIKTLTKEPTVVVTIVVTIEPTNLPRCVVVGKRTSVTRGPPEFVVVKYRFRWTRYDERRV